MMKQLTISLLSLLGFSCSTGNKKTTDKPPQESTAQSTLSAVGSASTPDSGYFTVTGDSVVIPAFTIDVNLSDKARKKLKEANETIIIAAYFSGIPKDSSSDEYKKSGGYYVASSKVELLNSYIARVNNVRFAKTRYDSLADKDIQVLINIYSGRKSTGDNLLTCDILEKPMSEVKGKRFTLKGKLIYGDD